MCGPFSCGKRGEKENRDTIKKREADGRKKRRRKKKEEKNGEKDPEEHTPHSCPPSFTYPNPVRLVLVLRASPRARAPSSPILFSPRLRGKGGKGEREEGSGEEKRRGGKER